MGSKRVGLARTQALIENLKRQLDLAGSDVQVKTLTSLGVITADSGGVSATAGDVHAQAGDIKITAATKGIVHVGRGTVTQATNHSNGVTVNASSGVITLAGVALAADTEAEFTLTNSTLKTTSMVFLTVEDNTTAADSCLTAQVHTVANGSCKIKLFNPGANPTSTNASKVNFLVINPTAN